MPPKRTYKAIGLGLIFGFARMWQIALDLCEGLAALIKIAPKIGRSPALLLKIHLVIPSKNLNILHI